jgi:hypothetical protein
VAQRGLCLLQTVTIVASISAVCKFFLGFLKNFHFPCHFSDLFCDYLNREPFRTHLRSLDLSLLFFEVSAMAIFAVGFSPTPQSRPANQIEVLRRLMEVFSRALQAKQDSWHFALHLADFRAMHIPATALGELVAEGLVAHGEEGRPHGAGLREAVPLGHVKFSDRSCFILTDLGLAIALALTAPEQSGLAVGLAGPPVGLGDEHLLPSFVHCDDGRRELRLGDRVVKVFIREAPNQETILKAFEEQHWVRHILDPLERKRGTNPKRRLHYAIVHLNQNQLGPFIQFHGDGTGQGIWWKVVERILSHS